MPHHRIRAHYEQMSEFERGRIIGLKEASWVNRRINRCMGQELRRRHSENCFITVPLAVPWPYFSEDNARPRTELPWPAILPDLSPIQHVCDMMGKRLHLPENGD
ncbi:hypothetical protein TNCV_315791 [Trichonephila clavipes]|nr:hypothetical protein TNCV_315791 [Trichonephila clavipes]